MQTADESLARSFFSTLPFETPAWIWLRPLHSDMSTLCYLMVDPYWLYRLADHSVDLDKPG